MGSKVGIRGSRRWKRHLVEGDPVLAHYLEDISDSKPLSSSQESDLARGIRAGDEGARNELVEANLRFVVSVSKAYQNRGLTLAELISAGNVGLLVAAERFDETKGCKFITYAVWWIRQSILQALLEQSTVRLPVNRLDMRAKIARVRETLQQQGSSTNLTNVARALGATEERVEQTLIESQPVRSLDATFDDEEEHCLLDSLCDENQQSPDQLLLEYAKREDIDAVLHDLNDREAAIVRLYFGLGNEPPMTLNQIGMRFQLTRERVRQIKETALCKMRHPRFCSSLHAHAEI